MCRINTNSSRVPTNTMEHCLRNLLETVEINLEDIGSTKIKRSKSLTSLPSMSETSYCDYQQRSRMPSGSSEVSVVDLELNSTPGQDSGIGDGDVLLTLEQLIHQLSGNDEHCRQLTEINLELLNSKAANEKSQPTRNKVMTQLFKKLLVQSREGNTEESRAAIEPSKSFNSRAKRLLDAIEAKDRFCLDSEIGGALVDFLQSDELKQRVVSASVEALGQGKGSPISREVASVFVPLVERSHRRLVNLVSREIENLSEQLEKKSPTYFNAVEKTSKSLHRAFEQHRTLVKDAVECSNDHIDLLRETVAKVLEEKLVQWRQKALDALPTPAGCNKVPENLQIPSPVPCSPYQTVCIDESVIDQPVGDEDVNSAFEKALCAQDLSLVMTACRAAGLEHVFGPPCCLPQPLLLSLLQQLATDMLYETNLKCSYLEGALMTLNTLHPVTRANLPLVAGAVRKHLTDFMAKYPRHGANRRIKLILIVIGQLLNKI